MENTGAVTTPQSEFDEWVQNGCKRAEERILGSAERQADESKNTSDKF